MADSIQWCPFSSWYTHPHFSLSLSLTHTHTHTHTHTPLGLGTSYRSENTGRTQRYHGHYFYSLPMLGNGCLFLKWCWATQNQHSKYIPTWEIHIHAQKSIPLDALNQNLILVFFSICVTKIYHLLSSEMPLFLFYFQHYNSRAKDSAVFWTLWYIIPTFWTKILTCNTWKFPFFKEKNIKGHRKPCC